MDSPPTPSQLQRAQATQKAMAEVKKIKAQRNIQDALNTRNGPNTLDRLPASLPLGSLVLVYREKKGWTGPHKVTAVTDKAVMVEMPGSGTSSFQNSHVKPYFQEEEVTGNTDEPITLGDPFARADDVDDNTDPAATAFLSTKEKDHLALALKFRAEGKIRTPGSPFEASDQAELDALLANGILRPVKYDFSLYRGATIFKSRMVREVKDRTTATPYEKSRLVVQGYSDPDKENIMTYAPTIQRASQRMLMALAPTLRQQGMKVMIRDITMAYTQSKTPMQRLILVTLSTELKRKYPEGTLLHVAKPLYGIAESGTYWFETYSRHHQQELGMSPSAFDPCLLITAADDGSYFGMTGLQTDDTLNVGTMDFLTHEDEGLKKAGIKAKPQKVLDNGMSEDFNGSQITLSEEHITITQKGQAERLQLLDPKSPEMPQGYVEQRARGAYIASICQPEAAFDYSTAVQHSQPGTKEAKVLNQRIQWQIDNKDRGLRFVPLDLATAKVFVFVNGSFANNVDPSSQIGYLVMLGNKAPTDQDNEVCIRGNIIHWSSTKCKRVTRSVLASEIYGMVQGFDAGFVIHHTINNILARLKLSCIPLVLLTDSFSLYQCIVQLGSTQEKRLMIDLMALRQSYENKEIDDIRWIHGTCNPADAMTKALPNKVMKELVDCNETIIRLEGWVKREQIE